MLSSGVGPTTTYFVLLDHVLNRGGGVGTYIRWYQQFGVPGRSEASSSPRTWLSLDEFGDRSISFLFIFLFSLKKKPPNNPLWIEFLKEWLTLGRGNTCVLSVLTCNH